MPGPLRRYNHDLLWRGVQMLSRRWGSRPVAPETMSGFMTSLPLPDARSAGESAAIALRDALLFEHRIEVDVSFWSDRSPPGSGAVEWCTRLSEYSDSLAGERMTS